ncbi:hypothetical protein PUN28_013050 [Cardiocondyla obscurior]|uniref:Uncharacterized protein n=1 Tax=Cardiocondyla obscurior TaxID=286306 RepID=A0AAW2F7Z3_9HYME
MVLNTVRRREKETCTLRLSSPCPRYRLSKSFHARANNRANPCTRPIDPFRVLSATFPPNDVRAPSSDFPRDALSAAEAFKRKRRRRPSRIRPPSRRDEVYAKGDCMFFSAAGFVFIVGPFNRFSIARLKSLNRFD